MFYPADIDDVGAAEKDNFWDANSGIKMTASHFVIVYHEKMSANWAEKKIFLNSTQTEKQVETKLSKNLFDIHLTRAVKSVAKSLQEKFATFSDYKISENSGNIKREK